MKVGTEELDNIAKVVYPKQGEVDPNAFWKQQAFISGYNYNPNTFTKAEVIELLDKQKEACARAARIRSMWREEYIHKIDKDSILNCERVI